MFNKNIITILLVTFCLVIFVFQHVQNLNKRVKMLESNKEKFTMTEDQIKQTVMKAVDSTYNMDTEAIRNLGAISKSILTGKNYHNLDGNVVPGKLVIPANVEIQGELTVHQKLIVTSGKDYNTAPGAVDEADGDLVYDKYVGKKKEKEKIVIEVLNGKIPKIQSYNTKKELEITTHDASPASVYGKNRKGGAYGGDPYNSLVMLSNKTFIKSELTIEKHYHNSKTVSHHDKYADDGRLPQSKIIITPGSNDVVPEIRSYNPAKELEISTWDSSEAAVTAGNYGHGGGKKNTLTIKSDKTEITKTLLIKTTKDDDTVLETFLGHNYFDGDTIYNKLDGDVREIVDSATKNKIPEGFFIQNIMPDNTPGNIIIKTDTSGDSLGFIRFKGREISAHAEDNLLEDRYPIKIPHLLLTEFHGMGLKDINNTSNLDDIFATKTKGIPEELQGDDEDELYFLTHHGGERETDGDWQWKIVPFMDKEKWASN
jgi:hypothetical protein